jgi:hypothetical protein
MMQRGAKNPKEISPLQAGYILLSEFEHSVRATVWSEIGRKNGYPHEHEGWRPSPFLDPDYAGLSADDKPNRAKQWAQTPRIRNLLAARRGTAMDGLVAAVVENVLCGATFAVSVWKEDILHPCGVDDLLLIAEPAMAPNRFQTADDYQGFAEFAANRRWNHPFLERDSWSIRETPRFDFACSEQEEGAMREVWSRIANLTGGFIVITRRAIYDGVSVPSRRAIIERGMKDAKSQLALLLSGAIPKDGTQAFANILRKALLFVELLPDAAVCTRSDLATELGFDAGLINNRPFGHLWKSVLENLPEDKRTKMSTPGKRKEASVKFMQSRSNIS